MHRGFVMLFVVGCGSGSHPVVADAPHVVDAAVDVAVDARVPMQRYLKAPDAAAGDTFGAAVAVSGDGQTLVAGAPGRASKTGAAYVFVKQQGVWAPQATLTASNADTNDEFGYAVALSGDGNLLAVSALNERSCATGIGGDQTSNTCPSGAVYLFTRTSGMWTQQAYVKPSNTTYTNGYVRAFGQAVALSTDGTTLAVGDPGESSNATGVGGDQTNVSAALSGAVFVFVYANAAWSQQAYIKASNTDASDVFGGAVSLSSTGDRLIVGAGSERSAARGVNGSQVDNSVVDAGAAYVFARVGTAWSQDAYVKASNTGHSDFFGNGVAMAGDGATFAVGAPGEASAATGVNGDQTDDSQLHAGAVYTFANGANGWSQQAYIKEQVAAHNADYFGNQVALSASGDIVLGGAFLAQAPTGMANGVMQSGAADQYARTGTTWANGPLWAASNADNFDAFGTSVALSSDGSVVVVGAPGEASAGTDPHDNSAANAGAVYVFE